MSDSVPPHRWSPRLPHPWDSPGKNIGVGCHFLLQCMKVKSESEVTQSCLTLGDPMDCSLLGSSVQWIFPARVLERGASAFSEDVLIKRSNLDTCVRVCCCFDCVQLFATLWTVGYQVPLCIGFSRQEYLNRLPFPSPGDLPRDWTHTPLSLLHCQVGYLPLALPGKLKVKVLVTQPCLTLCNPKDCSC